MCRGENLCEEKFKGKNKTKIVVPELETENGQICVTSSKNSRKRNDEG